MRKIALLGVALAALLFTHADAQQICCSGGGGGGSVTYPLTAPNGSSSAPSYSFANGTSSGVYADANGSVTVLGAAATTPGNVTLTGGRPPSGNATGGSINLNGAQPSTTGSGGGGSLNFNAGNASTTNAGGPAGNVTIQSGQGNGTQGNVDGNILIQTQNSGGGGTITILGGYPSSAHSNVVTIGAQQNTGSASDVLVQTFAGGNLKLLGTAAGAGATVLTTVGNTTSTFHSAGLVNTALTATGNGADITEDTLQTFSLPANALDVVGRCVRITSWGTSANNADAKTIRQYFGVATVSASLTVATANQWKMVSTVCKTAANTQTALGEVSFGASLANGFVDLNVTAPAQTDTSAIVIKTTGQAGAANANDIICTAQLIEFLS